MLPASIAQALTVRSGASISMHACGTDARAVAPTRNFADVHKSPSREVCRLLLGKAAPIRRLSQSRVQVAE